MRNHLPHTSFYHVGNEASQKESPILDHNLVKTALCKEVSKSVSFLAQWDKICNSPL